MNEEPTTFTTLNENYQQKHTMKKGMKTKLSLNKLPFIRKKVKDQKLLKKHNNMASNIISKGGCSPFPWRLISCVLGVMFLLLMVATITVAFFTANSFSERTSSSMQQKGPCCHPCPKNWVWFRCNCYYFSKEQLSWRESQNVCLSLNSSLLKINRDEMNFFSLNSFFWIGAYYNEIFHQWVWENDSALPPYLFQLPRPQMQQACLSYKSKEIYFSETCKEKQGYICKKH
uniref:Natural killer cells antigen CD94-like n=1 Tax=Marmota marmota marmota TaxID=9994 RepID=A0A8C6A6M0_MARMA